MNPFRIASERPDDGQSTLTIPDFSGDRPKCRKCHHDHIIGSRDKYDPTSDTLSRTCTSCGYTWIERPADSGCKDGQP